MNEIEEWRWIDGYEGRYEISNTGRVRSYTFSDPVIMRVHPNINGYPVVCLSPRIKGKTRLVHRLVAQAFLPNPQNLPLVNHIDSNRANPKLSNLEWATNSDNVKHAYKTGRLISPLRKFFGEKAMSAKLTERQVQAIRAEYTGSRGETLMLSKTYGVSDHAIRDVLSRHSWKHI